LSKCHEIQSAAWTWYFRKRDVGANGNRPLQGTVRNHDSGKPPERTHEPAKVELKAAVSPYRATVSAAFYFGECFMDELAADCVWKLARVRFVGPITIEVRSETKDDINAFRHDLDFGRNSSRGIRRQVAS
jgi:hypothetical protein